MSSAGSKAVARGRHPGFFEEPAFRPVFARSDDLILLDTEQKGTSKNLLLISCLYFIPNRSFQYWRASSEQGGKLLLFRTALPMVEFISWRNAEVKTKFHLIMDDF